MFLLITSAVKGCMDDDDFNTSHVSINPGVNIRCLMITNISIHLMFLLIVFLGRARFGTVQISIHLMFLLIAGRMGAPVPEWLNFNTSHVSINRLITAIGY